MKRLFVLILLISSLVLPVGAVEYTAPDVPQNVEDLMPVETESFSEGLWKIIQNVTEDLRPRLISAVKLCGGVICTVIAMSLLRQIPGYESNICEFAGVIAVAGLLLSDANTMIQLGADTVNELSEYGKLLLPVMTAAMAASGSITTSGAIYTGTAIFDAVLCNLISKLLVPAVYVMLILAIASSATGEPMLKKLCDLMNSTFTWALRTLLYIFTGYISITGVVSGNTDAAALKATKLTVSGMVPVVGGILSDASEAVLVGAGVVKNAVGVYGLLAVVAIWINPFFQIGIQYLLLKLTATVCEVFGIKPITDMIQAFCSVMGMLLAMTGAVCIMLLVSTVCFMRGVA